MQPAQKEKILGMLSDHPTAVIATADMDGNPAAAVVLFAENDNLEIIFGTHPTRKFRNLQVNPKVAMAFARGMSSIQYHGTAKQLEGKEYEEGMKAFVTKHPEASQHMLEGTVFFKILPSWIRYTDMSQKPMEIFEVTL